MEQDLLNKKLDAFLYGQGYESKSGKVTQRGPVMKCASAGGAVMTRYGSRLIGWFNEALDEMKESGEFRQLCQQAQRDHGHKGVIECKL